MIRIFTGFSIKFKNNFNKYNPTIMTLYKLQNFYFKINKQLNSKIEKETNKHLTK